MLLDALTLMDNGASLTGIAAGATGYSNVLDLSQSRDIGPDEVPWFAVFSVAPTSATGGATLNVALQTSSDNVTWVTLDETSAQPIANYTGDNLFLFRGTVPAGGLRYYRVAYTPSAVLTAGTVYSSIGAEWPRTKSYPRNYVA